MPKEMGGTLKKLARMWGRVRGEEKWRTDRTRAPEGWLEEGRGSLAWRDPRGLEDQWVAHLAFPLPSQAPESLLGSQTRSSAL